MYITGLIDYVHYSKAFDSNVSPLEQEIYKPIFKCYAGKYFLGSAENHIDLAQLMVEHGLAKTTSCNFKCSCRTIISQTRFSVHRIGTSCS